MEASIVIPAYNVWAKTERCLDALQRTARNADVIVVDNGSTDETAERLSKRQRKERAYDLSVVTHPTNRNFAGGSNAGLALAECENVVFLNNDTVPQPGWLLPLLERLDDPTVGVVGSLLWYPGKPQRAQHAGMAFSGEQKSLHLYRGMTAVDAPGIHHGKDLQCVTGACMALRTTDARAVGGFDEGYVNGWEDVCLCFSIRFDLGLRCVYEPRSQVIHEEAQSPGRFCADEPNRERFMAKWESKVRSDARDIIQRIDGGVRTG